MQINLIMKLIKGLVAKKVTFSTIPSPLLHSKLANLILKNVSKWQNKKNKINKMNKMNFFSRTKLFTNKCKSKSKHTQKMKNLPPLFDVNKSAQDRTCLPGVFSLCKVTKERRMGVCVRGRRWKYPETSFNKKSNAKARQDSSLRDDFSCPANRITPNSALNSTVKERFCVS